MWAVVLAAVSLFLASFSGRRAFATGAIAIFLFLTWILANIIVNAEAGPAGIGGRGGPGGPFPGPRPALACGPPPRAPRPPPPLPPLAPRPHLSGPPKPMNVTL